MAPEIVFESVNDLKVRVMRKGQGSKMLFLHGAGGFPGWLPLFDKLALDHEVIVTEHPGFGGSDDAPGLVNVSDMAFFYLDFFERYGLRDVHLMGHSLGGWIAAEIAIRDCSRLASLSLLAPAGVRIKGVQGGDNFIWGPEEAVRNVFYDQSFAERILAREVSDAERDMMLRTKFMAARLGWEPRWFNPHLEKWLHRIRTRSLVVWGAEDQLLPAAYAEVWKRRLTDVRVEILPECGHSPHVEKMAAVAARLEMFLAGAGA